MALSACYSEPGRAGQGAVPWATRKISAHGARSCLTALIGSPRKIARTVSGRDFPFRGIKGRCLLRALRAMEARASRLWTLEDVKNGKSHRGDLTRLK